MFRYLKPFFQFLWEVAKVALLSLAIILPVRYFLVQPFYVKGASMEPNFMDHDYLLIDELSFRFRTPAHGEVIVFHYPKDPRQYFIKRVVGLPGDRVVVRDGAVWVGAGGGDLKPDAEPYLDSAVRTQPESPTYSDVVLLPNQYFVMGDNRSASLDSRSFGPVTKQEIIGRIWVRGWPFSRLALYHPGVVTP